MVSLKDIRKRLRSARNTQKITKAMKMVAASKLKRAQDNVKRARPYSLKIEEIILNIVEKANEKINQLNPLLLDRKDPQTVEILVVTSDRGLCGGFNNNIIKKLEEKKKEFLKKYKNVKISTIGKKGFDRAKKLQEFRYNYDEVVGSYNDSLKIVQDYSSFYLKKEVDNVFVIYNEFKSAMLQEVKVKQLFPIVYKNISKSSNTYDYIYEPSQDNLLDYIVPKYFETKVFQILLESIASENGARMTAMDNAVRNAEDMISKLNLTYNRLRQAKITSELMEIIGGAEAL